MSIDKCRIIDFPKMTDNRGDLVFVEGHKHIPFDIRRIYYISNVPNGLTRGGHMNKETEQVIIAMSGRFKVRLHDTHTEKIYVLDRPDSGLYIPQGIWHRIEDLSQGSIVLVLASTLYDEKDYVKG